MYLTIGKDIAVRDKSIVGIFDLDNTTTSKRTREFLARAEEAGEVIPCDTVGYTAVSVCGAVTGFGKASSGQLKNHYPKALRRPL